jgi:hypothetical protein
MKTELMKNRILVFAALFCLTLVPFQNNANAAELQSEPLRYYHETADEQQLAELLGGFGFNEYISMGKSEFEQMALLKNWVYHRIPYELNYNDSELRNSINILQRAAKGDSFICTNKAYVFLQCAVSLGWTSRYILLKKQTGEEHAGNDIWSNLYRKWIYIDTTWNIHIEKNNVPLSILEIRKEWLNNGGASIVYVFGAGAGEKRYRQRDLPVVRAESKIWKYMPLDRTWIGYSNEITVLGRNDFFSCCVQQNGSNAWEPMYTVYKKAGLKEKLRAFFKKGNGYTPKMIFHDLNRVDISIVQQHGKKKGYYPGKAEVRLDAFGKNNYTPNFMEFLVKVDNEEWRVADERFQIRIKPGSRYVRARIMNKFGVLGPISVKHIKVKNRPSGVRQSGAPQQ